MHPDRGTTGWLIFIVASIISLVFLIASLFMPPAYGRDNGQWEGSDPEVRQWYRSLMQPDNPNASCCGVADAYWCDDIAVRSGKTYCRITDPRPDAPLGRPHREIGEEFEIPRKSSSGTLGIQRGTTSSS